MKLNNGVEMLVAGIGTFMLSPDEAENSVPHAMERSMGILQKIKNRD